nr:MAG TPA: hypothetical protein [Caudoviricetes sp.]
MKPARRCEHCEASGTPESGAPEKYPKLFAERKGPRPVAEGRQLFGE